MRSSKYNAALLAPIVQSSRSLAEVLGRLGLSATGGNYRHIAARIRQAGLDIGHLRGRGWARGETKTSHASVDRISKRKAFSNEAVFVENGPFLGGPKIVPRLLAMGWLYRCAWCEIVDWRGQRLVLHLDHINGINNDNRLLDLRLLCPNCHSQTKTYSNRRR
jgi:hypothetical protein